MEKTKEANDKDAKIYQFAEEAKKETELPW